MGAYISTLWSIPFFIFLPPFLALLLPLDVAKRWRKTVPVALAVYLSILLIGAPLIYAKVLSASKSNEVVPARLLAGEVDALWREGSTIPLTIAGGDTFLANAQGFYSSFHPLSFQGMNYAFTPWIGPEDIRARGAAFMCQTADQNCVTVAKGMLERVDLERNVSLPGPQGSPVPTYEFHVMIRYPG